MYLISIILYKYEMPLGLTTFLYILLLFILSIQDLKNLEVDLFVYLITILLIILNGKYIYSFCFTSTVLIALIFINDKESIALADVFLMATCSTHIEIEQIGFFLILVSITSLFYSFLYNKKKIALIPFISFSFFIFKAINKH